MKLDVRINRVFEDRGNLKGVASVNFEGCFAVTGIRVMENKDGGLFVSMPSRKGGDRQYHDIAFPVTKDFREEFNGAVIEAYEQALEQTQEPEESPEMTI